jgi:hypothetical protein
MDFFVKRTLNRVSVLFLLISAIPILFVSCNRQGNHKKLEALRNQCEEYAVQSQTDTLRSAASRYLLHAKKGSKDYYYALYFQVLSDFNVKDYSKVVNRISKITDTACSCPIQRRCLPFPIYQGEGVSEIRTIR